LSANNFYYKNPARQIKNQIAQKVGFKADLSKKIHHFFIMHTEARKISRWHFRVIFSVKRREKAKNTFLRLYFCRIFSKKLVIPILDRHIWGR